MWNELVGTWGYAAGNAPATVTVPAGATIISILAHASSSAGSFTIFGGASIAVPATAEPIVLRFNHRLVQANAGSQSVVFGTNIDMYFVEWVKAGNV